MATTMQKMRSWRGPAILSYGFRPFFLGAAVWAALSMILWLGMLAGGDLVPISIDPVSWHAHEFLFGYLSAVFAGFILTAVPNWTGRLPIVGWPLGGLVALWILGRMAFALSGFLPWGLVLVMDLSMPVVLAFAIAREIIIGKNWRNLVVLALLFVLILGNLVFHIEAGQDEFAAAGVGIRLGLASGVMMIAVIGGRIVPSFTRNWLVKSGSEARPAPLGRFDQVGLLAAVVSLLLWVALPDHPATALALIIMGALHLARMMRWQGINTLKEPLVWVLHMSYLFIPLGALVLGVAILIPEALAPSVAQHLWMAGAIGLMTLAVMTRATLGHTGRALHAGGGTVLIYLALVVSVLARVLAGVFPEVAPQLHMAAGITWIAAFAGFAVLYGPLHLRPRPEKGA